MFLKFSILIREIGMFLTSVEQIQSLVKYFQLTLKNDGAMVSFELKGVSCIVHDKNHGKLMLEIQNNSVLPLNGETNSEEPAKENGRFMKQRTFAKMAIEINMSVKDQARLSKQCTYTATKRKLLKCLCHG